MSNEIAPTTEQAVSVVTPTGLASNITAQDLRLPRVALLQSLSPQVTGDDTNTYKPGMFIDTLTQEVLPSPLVFTPVFLFKNVIKWKPRAEGGGMIYKTTNFTPAVLKDLQWDGDKKPLADQYINVVCLVQNYDLPLIISFCKTSLKAGQDLLTLVQLSGQAWKFQYCLEAVKISNAKGTFHVMRVKRSGPTQADRLVEAVSLYENVKNMSIDTDYESSSHESHQTTNEPTEF